MWHEKQLLAVIEKIQTNDSILVIGHIDPDGDDISSMLGLTLGLRRMGKQAIAVVDSPIPETFRPLLLTDQILDWDRFCHLHTPKDFECLVVVDASSRDRIGRFEMLLGSMPSVVIDHHATNTNFGDVNWVDSSAAATAQMVLWIFQRTELGLDPVLSTLLLMGIQTDSGFFKYSNTDARLLEDAARLARFGADPSFTANLVLENQRPEYFALLARMIHNMQMDPDLGIAFSYLRKEDVRDYGNGYSDTSGFVGVLRSVKGMEVALFFSEEEEGKIKTHMRSKDWFDIATVALHFGGGGHPKAAGCTLLLEMDEAIDSVLTFTKDQMEIQRKNRAKNEEGQEWGV